VLVAPNGRIIAWNPAFKDLSGRSDEELVSIAFDQSIHADDKAPFLAAMRRLIEGEVPSVKMELRYVGGEKPQAWALTSVSLVRSEAGEIDHLVVQIVDTTSRRQAERQLQQAQKMEAVGQLTGGLAHDFNNLLTVILGNLNLIENAVDGDGKARQRLLEAAEAAKKGSELTRQLLGFSSQQGMEPKEVRVNDLIRHMLSLIARTIGEAVELQLMLSPESALVEVDPTQLETSLINLAINGRDAMGGGGKLTIETRIVDLDQDYVTSNPDVRTGRHVVIAVTDSGSGIPKSLLDKVFHPFFTTKPAGKGSGLGLSMVYGFATRSGGHVRIYSEEGHGTSVKIYLPVKAVDLADSVMQSLQPLAVIDAETRFEPEPFQAEVPPQAAEPTTQAEEPETSRPLDENIQQAPEPKAPAEHSAPNYRAAGWKTIPPLAPPSPKPVPLRRENRAAPAEPPLAERQVKILVVEDQEGVRAVATGFLTDFGYDVIEAADGIAALDILTQQDDIDLMFTDVVMPGGLNGFDLAQAAQQIRPDLRIVHTSGYPKGAMVHMEEPRLKDNIIMKPYRRDELKRVIEETLQKSAS